MATDKTCTTLYLVDACAEVGPRDLCACESCVRGSSVRIHEIDDALLAQAVADGETPRCELCRATWTPTEPDYDADQAAADAADFALDERGNER